jgi:hypothetical protein
MAKTRVSSLVWQDRPDGPWLYSITLSGGNDRTRTVSGFRDTYSQAIAAVCVDCEVWMLDRQRARDRHPLAGPAGKG